MQEARTHTTGMSSLQQTQEESYGGHVGWSDEETSDDDEQQEMTNLALMALGEELCDKLDEVNDLPTFDELHNAFK